ncbi:MAG: PAS domain S-box protein [Brumimicrobium sp.]
MNNLNIVLIAFGEGGFEPLKAVIEEITLYKESCIILVSTIPLSEKELSLKNVEINNYVVNSVKNGSKLNKNTIYTLESNTRFIKDKFNTDQEADDLIDVLFEDFSLINDHFKIGLILSGSGINGSLGFRNFKHSGGMLIVQEPESAKFKGLPNIALKTGVVDHFFIPDKIGKLFKYLLLDTLKPVSNLREETEIKNEELSTINQNYFNAFISHSNDSFSVLDKNGNVKFTSGAIKKTLGYTIEEALKLNLAQIVHPDDIGYVSKTVEKALKHPGKTFTSNIARIKHKNGEWRWMEAHLTNLLDDPKINGILDVYRDVTEKVKANEKLLHSREQYQNLFDLSPVPSFIYNHKTNEILDVNEIALERYQYTKNELIGEKIFKLQPPNISPDNHIEDFSIEGLDHFESKKLSYHKYKNGNIEIVEVTYLPIHFQGEPCRVMYCKNVTHSINRHLRNKWERDIARLFRDKCSVNDTLKEITKYLADFGSFNLAEIWIKGIDNNEIKLYHNHFSTYEGAIFYEEKNLIDVFKKGEGLPGYVWKTGETTLWEGKSLKNSFVRHESAERAGIKAVIGIPMKSGEELIGVLVLATQKSSSELMHFEIRYDGIGKFLGAEVQRKQLDEELEFIYQNAPFIFAVANSEGRFVKVNKAFVDLLGYEEEVLLSKSFIDFVHPDDVESTLKEYEGTKGNIRTAFKFENRYLTKSGEYKWISWSSSKGLRESSLSLAYGLDITEAKELESLLNNATELARIGGWEVDLVNNVHNWSKVTKDILEVEPDFKPNKYKAIEFYSKDFKNLIENHVESLIKRGDSFDLEVKIVTAKENERWIRVVGDSEFLNGRCIKIFGSIQDIHIRKMAELRLTGIIDNIPGVIFQYALFPDGHSSIMQLSNGTEQYWGVSPGELAENSAIFWNQVENAGDYSDLYSDLIESKQSLTKWNTQFRSKRADGEVLWLEVFGSPQKLQNGCVVWDTLIVDITEKKELELLLKQSSKMARIGSWELLLNDDNEKLYLSPIMRDILKAPDNYTPSLENYYDAFTPMSKVVVKKAVKNLIKRGEYFDVELQVYNFEDEDLWVRCIGQAETVNNKPVKIYGSFQDIDQRKIAELELEKAYKEKNIILESIGDGFFAVDYDWKIMYWNSQAETLLEVKKENVIGENLWNVFKDAKKLDFFKEYELAMKTGKSSVFDAHYPKINKWFEVSVFPSNNGLSVYFKDITVRIKSQKQITLSNERFEKVAEATSDAIWDWDITDDKLYRGPGFEKLFGDDIPKELQVEKFWGDGFHPGDKKMIKESVENLIADKKAFNWALEYRIIGKDQKIRTVLDKGVVIRDDDGTAVRMIGAISDITHRKEYENSLKDLNENLSERANELARSNAELEQFAYVASHDLQEPLRMVTSFLSRLETRYDDVLDEKGKQFIHFAVDGAKRMRKIILDLLAISRIGNEEEEKQEVDLNKLVEEICILQENIIAEKKAKVSFENLPVVVTYKSSLIQVLQNLISNGLKYSRNDKTPEIHITCEEEADKWLFAIKDNGIGLSEEYYSKIFEIFQRLHAKNEYEGTGIGLAIVKKIIENLGGEIWVDSKVDKGSTFYFTLKKET